MSRLSPTQVPRLDLAPKLNRPLSPWKPLDYLRLLYWVLYFPQALRWYVDTFGRGCVPLDERALFITLKNEISNLREHQNESQLLIQGLILSALISLTLLLFKILFLGTSINLLGIVFGFIVGAILNCLLSLIFGVAYGLAFGVCFSLFGGLAFGILLAGINPFSQLSFGTFFVNLISLILLFFPILFLSSFAAPVIDKKVYLAGNYVINSFGWLLGIATIFVAGFIIYSIVHLFLSIFSGDAALLSRISFLIAFFWILCFYFLSIRLDCWLLGYIELLRGQYSKGFQLSALTPLPLPFLEKNLSAWLRQDWNTGLLNANEVLVYTSQIYPVIRTLNKELDRLEDDLLMYRLSQTFSSIFDLSLLRFLSASLSNYLMVEYINTFLLVFPFRKRITARIKTKLRFNTPAHAAAAGFWLLYKKAPEAAFEAFSSVQGSLYGEEMSTLSVCLVTFKSAAKTSDIAGIRLPDFPKTPLLRPVTWKAMQRFCNVVSDTKTIVGSVSRTSKAFASTRALGELQRILDYVNELPEAERQLIEDIAKQWRDALLDVAESIGQQTVDRPVQNPYIVGDPVEGSLFVGRDDILRQLEELWLMGRQMQSVVLYGHRRMGKTSILRNAAKTVGSGLRVVYVNMLRSASAESVSDVLIAMTDEMSEILDIHPPSDEELMANPTRAFDRYLRRVLASLNEDETLIIAIDEFEKIEELIDTGKLSPDFIAYLRGLVQMSPKLGFAFAGLHTLEEMTQDYFNPFFASVIPIRVGFLQPGAVKQLLANPDPEFPLDYRTDALDRIYQLTTGQPYLTQLVGFQLVRRFNDQVFEQGNQRESSFTVADVDAVTADPELFKRGRYYFTGVWDQAGRDVPDQQVVLQALAPHPNGLKLEELKSATRLRRAKLADALNLLQRHDVVNVQDEQAYIAVELFRRWLLRQQP